MSRLVGVGPSVKGIRIFVPMTNGMRAMVEVRIRVAFRRAQVGPVWMPDGIGRHIGWTIWQDQGRTRSIYPVRVRTPLGWLDAERCEPFTRGYPGCEWYQLCLPCRSVPDIQVTVCRP